mgnify:CR=1 FL=1
MPSRKFTPPESSGIVSLESGLLVIFGVIFFLHKIKLNTEKLEKENTGIYIYNLGTGTGYSVLDMINAFEKANNVKVNYVIGPRREGDIDECYSDPTKANNELNWKAELTIEDMCRDSWNYIEKSL